MKIVIDIDDNVFTRLFDNGVDTSSEDRKVIDRAVRNGTPYEERPHGEWILIAERLPDRFDDVLVTVLTASGELKVRSGFYADECFFLDTGNTWNWNDPEIKAWMPLPEAYKEADND